MKILPCNDETLRDAAAVLNGGGVAVIPTDTVYGLAARPSFPEAVERLYSIKGREKRKKIALLAADVAAVEMFGCPLPPKARELAEKYWPGALTIIIRKKSGLPANLTSNDLIGLRIPDHKFTRELIRLTGPLAVTSANVSGRTPAKSVTEFGDMLSSRLDLIIDDGPSLGGVPSSVINCETDPAVILREGAISGKELLAC